MKRAAELLLAAILMLLLPVLAGHRGLPAPYVDPFGGTAQAVQPDEVLPDPALERRARAISLELRCLVCQNQSIDDSDAGLARDLRLLVRDRLRAGEDDAAVLDYVVARYGEFVLLKPRLGSATLLLWGTPVLLLAIGLAYVLRSSRRTNAAAASDDALGAEEERAVERLLAGREAAGEPPNGRAA